MPPGGRVVHEQPLGRLLDQLRDVAAEIGGGNRREQGLVDGRAVRLRGGGEQLGAVMADGDIGHHQVPGFHAAALGEFDEGLDLHAIGDADAEIVRRAVLAGEIVGGGGVVDEQRIEPRHLGLDGERRAGGVEAGEERDALVLHELSRRLDRRGRLAVVVLDDELVFAAERAALRVEGLDGERRAVVDEGAADGEGPGVDVDDAELDRVFGESARVKAPLLAPAPPPIC